MGDNLIMLDKRSDGSMPSPGFDEPENHGGPDHPPTDENGNERLPF